MKTETIIIRTEKELKQQIENKAKEKGLSVSAWGRMVMKAALIFLFSISINAQEAIGFQVTQDNRLFVLGDDHGNSPFTPDLQFKVVLQGNDSKTGYLVISPKFEYAQLAGGDYSRFGAEVGYAFHTYILKIDIAPSIGYGYMFRHDSRSVSWEFSTEIKIPLTKNLSVISLVNVNQRHDLKNAPWRYNVGTGLRFDIPTGWNGKQTRF